MVRVAVENGPRFTTMLVNTKGLEQHCPPCESVLILDSPVSDVRKVRLVFAVEISHIHVDEIRVLGAVPAGVEFKVTKPAILKTDTERPNSHPGDLK